MLVKVNRNRKLVPDSFARLVGQRHAIFDRDAADGNKRQHVSSANARMLASMISQIDQLRRSANRAKRSLDDHLRRSDECYYRTIVICVDMPIENYHSAHRLNRASDLFDHFRLAAFAEVWYTLDDRIANCGLRMSNLICHLPQLVREAQCKSKIRIPKFAIRNRQCLWIASSTNARTRGSGLSGYCTSSTA